MNFVPQVWHHTKNTRNNSPKTMNRILYNFIVCIFFVHYKISRCIESMLVYFSHALYCLRSDPVLSRQVYFTCGKPPQSVTYSSRSAFFLKLIIKINRRQSLASRFHFPAISWFDLTQHTSLKVMFILSINRVFNTLHPCLFT